MAKELGTISFYLAKNGQSFSSVTKKDLNLDERDNFKVRHFSIDDTEIVFFCEQSCISKKDNPPWLDFVNEKLPSDMEQIHFETFTKRVSGLLLIKIQDQILAAAFGVRGGVLLDKDKFLSDFGIKTAMNMCGNRELRQTKSSTHAITTAHIDRQLSKPSDAFSFGLEETELLQYISAQLKDDKKVTLQGKDNLTIKIIGDNKLTWELLIEYANKFITEYTSDRYKTLFPNYPNFQDVTNEKAKELDLLLLNKIKEEDHSCMHLAIPEFIEDDKYSFSYSNFKKKENVICSHIDVDDLKQNQKVINFNKLTTNHLKNKHVYAYSHGEDRILEYRKWKLYDCFVAEVKSENDYFVLSGGVWRKVDDEFYIAVNNFIENVLPIEDIDSKYHDIDISDHIKKQNREDIFNIEYDNLNDHCVLFDKAKLRIGQGKRNNEFCDLLELNKKDKMSIIHVKKYGSSNSINHLFSQARFYCEFFLSDEVFLSEIREHINQSGNVNKEAFISYVKEDQAEVNGKDYDVKLWVLYDSSKNAPEKAELPLMAKYELKLTYERLRNAHKYNSITLSMIPVHTVKFKKHKTNNKNN